MEIFEANQMYADRFGSQEGKAACNDALALVVPRLQALETHLGSSQGVTAPRRAVKGAGIERLRDVARGLQKRVTLAKLIGYDPHIRPYLAALRVGSLAALGEKLVVPADLEVQKVTAQEFQDRFAEMSNRVYDQHGSLGTLMGFPST